MLWTNPNPSTPFSPATVQFSEDYNCVAIVTVNGSGIIYAGVRDGFVSSTYGANDGITGASYVEGRLCSLGSDKRTLTLNKGYAGYINGSLSENNSASVPLYVIGLF